MTTPTTKLVDYPQIDRALVVRTYSGRQGCMCGCIGRYCYARANLPYTDARANLPYTDEQSPTVSDSAVTRIVRKLQTSKQVEVSFMPWPERGVYQTCYLLDDPDTGRRVAAYVMTLPNVETEVRDLK